jgi:hypothetical protein
MEFEFGEVIQLPTVEGTYKKQYELPFYGGILPECVIDSPAFLFDI